MAKPSTVELLQSMKLARKRPERTVSAAAHLLEAVTETDLAAIAAEAEATST